MKLKNMLIALMMVTGTALMAQDKYEQAIVAQYNGQILISIEGKEFKKKDIKPYTAKDQTPVLNEVAEMREAGWEVWNATSVQAIDGATYFLRRKLK